MGVIKPSAWAGLTSFAPNEQALYITYDVIAFGYPGWNLSEIRALTVRQREYWVRMIRWKKDRYAT